MKLFKNAITKFIVLIFFILCYGNSNAQMFWNQACQFAGNSGSYVAVPNSTLLNITSSFTLEAWVFPSSVTGTEKGIISKGSTLGASLRYSLKISTTGRVTLSTNGILRLTSTVALVANNWTHVCGTYNSATNVFSIYLNGVLNTSAAVASAVPTSNTDSLFIGIAGAGLPYSGLLDEVRIWNRDISVAELSQFYRTSLGATGPAYVGLALSITFQNRHSGGTKFSLTDWSGNGNNGFNRNVTALDQSNKPYNTIMPNECVTLDGTGDYLIGPSNSFIIPTGQITLEAWIYPRNFTSAPVIISKNSSTSYKLGLSATGKIQFYPKGGASFLESKSTLTGTRWTHIAATYDGEVTSIYVNGNLDTAAFSIFGSIGTNTDSLTIGCDNVSGTLSNFFNGLIDEARISNYAKSNSMIKSYLYKSIDSVNQPNSAFSNVSYNLDGYTVDNADGGPRLYFKNDAKFNNPGTVANQPISPLNRADEFSYTEGFNVKQTNKRIPLSSGTGTVDDSLYIPFNITISDLNLFVGLNHTDDTNLDFFLIGPNGESLDFSTDNSMVSANDNVVTIFDDQADSLVTTVSYTAFAPRIRPEKNFSTKFNGDLTQGTWILRITDDGGNTDTGRVYVWGLQFNNSSVADRVTSLNLTTLIEGFWDGASMVQDTVRIYLRNTTNPYTITDSSRVLLNSSGNGLLSFINTGNSTKYVVVKHRNTVETWSAAGVVFKLDSTTNYNFTTASNKAYGNNLILNGGKFCMYNGDSNQDGNIDLSDLSLIENAATLFTVGYVVTDINGDNFVDIADLTIAENNAFNFVGLIRP